MSPWSTSACLLTTPTTDIRAAKKIREEHPGTGVLVLSQYLEESYALDLVADSAEGVGYLLKDRVAEIDRFTDSVRRVGSGGSALDPEVVSHLLGRRRREDPARGADRPGTRSPRARWRKADRTSRSPRALVVTERAVEKHVTSIFSKLDLAPTAEDHRRVLAVLTYVKAIGGLTRR